VIPLLKAILRDSRQDWPSNGAALAFLQYALRSLQCTELFLTLEDHAVRDSLAAYLAAECSNPETRRHVQEAMCLLAQALEKREAIVTIMRDNCFAASA